MTGTLQVHVSKIGLRVYPEVYIVAKDVTGASLFGDLVPYCEERFYELGTGPWTIIARNEVTGEIQEKDVEIFDGQTTSVGFTFGLALTPEIAYIPITLGSVLLGLISLLIGVS